MAIVETGCRVAADRAGRIDRVVQVLTGRSRADVRGLFDHECVRLNGDPCPQPGTPVKAGDAVSVRHDPRVRYPERRLEPKSPAYRLVFEDDGFLVVDKAAGVLTVPTEHAENNTLVDALNRYLDRRGRRRRATVVHRLDRGTSGLLVVGTDARTARALRTQFKVRKCERVYAAIVAGTLARSEQTFESQLATTKSLRRYSIRPSRAKGRPAGQTAITHYRVEAALRDATYVHVRLETGRRNQIRVHFAEAGHPVLGDDRYGVERARHAGWTAKRLALHAAVLGFDHPHTGRPLQFESPLPDEFDRFLEKYR